MAGRQSPVQLLLYLGQMRAWMHLLELELYPDPGNELLPITHPRPLQFYRVWG